MSGDHRKPSRPDQQWVSCSHCRKRSYWARRGAKAALKLLYRGETQQMRVYRCSRGGTGWHIGHRDPRFEPAPTSEHGLDQLSA